MFEVLIALLLIEGILLVSWNRAYWAWGLPLFSRRIAVPTSALLHFPLDRLEGEVVSEQWPALLFRPLSGRICAFRESFGIHFGWRYRRSCVGWSWSTGSAARSAWSAGAAGRCCSPSEP